MLTLRDVDVAISAAERWPVGTDEEVWAIVDGVPEMEPDFALYSQIDDPEDTIP